MWPSLPRYEKVPETEPTTTGSTNSITAWSTETISHHPSKNISCSSSRFLILGAIAVVSTVLVVGVVILSVGPASFLSQKNSAHSIIQHCGNTTAQAKENGCEFDLLSYSWVPTACYDRETADEFRQWVYDPDRKRGSWPFFEDDQMTKSILDEDSLSERIHAWSFSTQEEHMGHCTFLARRLHRAIEGNLMLPSRTGSVGHTLHCTGAILDKFSQSSPLDERSRFGVGIGTCH